MKQIIGGKAYNTDTADYIGDYSYGDDTSNFEWYEESLYRKKNGEFFLSGEGGPLSKYSQPSGPSGWVGGRCITPLSDAEAKEWGEEYLNYDKYVEVFGEPEE